MSEELTWPFAHISRAAMRAMSILCAHAKRALRRKHMLCTWLAWQWQVGTPAQKWMIRSAAPITA